MCKSYDYSQIHILFSIKLESERYYPKLWKELINTLFKEGHKYNPAESLNILINLKLMLAREIHNKSIKQDYLVVKNDFNSLYYHKISHRFNFIIKFFYERYNIFSNIFFSKDYLIDNINTQKDEKTFVEYLKSESSNVLPFEKDLHKMFADNENIDFKVKSEVYIRFNKILNILYLTIRSIDKTVYINNDLTKFILELVEIDVEYEEKQENSILTKLRSLSIYNLTKFILLSCRPLV